MKRQPTPVPQEPLPKKPKTTNLVVYKKPVIAPFTYSSLNIQHNDPRLVPELADFNPQQWVICKCAFLQCFKTIGLHCPCPVCQKSLTFDGNVIQCATPGCSVTGSEFSLLLLELLILTRIAKIPS